MVPPPFWIKNNNSIAGLPATAFHPKEGGISPEAVTRPAVRSCYTTFMQTPTQCMENTLRKRGYCSIAGCDEAGRGAWAGPLVAAAVILPIKPRLRGVRDSKLLSGAAREELYEKIIAIAHAWNVSVIPASDIDEHGVGHANMNALREAVLGLSSPADHVLSDAFDLAPFPVPCTPIVRGDAAVYCIAAASILAKVTRDRLMRTLHMELPHYNFAQHKGYGTPEHQRAVARHGPSAHHRASFVPIAEILRQQERYVI